MLLGVNKHCLVMSGVKKTPSVSAFGFIALLYTTLVIIVFSLDLLPSAPLVCPTMQSRFG